jgi:hypothetical protein
METFTSVAAAVVRTPLRATPRPDLPTETPVCALTALTATATPTDVPGLPVVDNPGFEEGHVGWTEIPGNALITQFSGVAPHAGSWLAHLGGENDSQDELQQTITLPPDGPLYLRFYEQLLTPLTDSGADEFRVFVNGALVYDVDLDYINDTGETWVVVTKDLSAYAGQTVTIRFVIFTDHDDPSSVYLDDANITR